MKKIILSAATLLSVMVAFGQQTTQPEQKKAAVPTSTQDILPVQGDFGLTVGATTALNYLGNFNGKNAANNNSGMFDYANKNLPTVVIAGKYFTQDNVAYRISACAYYNSTTKNNLVHDDLKLDKDAYVFDKAKYNTSGYTIALGIEKRRGYKRLQGIYGAEIFMGTVGSQNYNYTYANKFSEANQAPTSAATGGFTYASNTGVPTPALGYRLVSEHTSSTFNIGARAILGMEYYFASKMSIGGEFYWGLQYSTISKESSTWEYYNTVTKDVDSQTIQSKNNKAFNLGISNLGGSLNLNFYF